MDIFATQPPSNEAGHQEPHPSSRPYQYGLSAGVGANANAARPLRDAPSHWPLYQPAYFGQTHSLDPRDFPQAQGQHNEHSDFGREYVWQRRTSTSQINSVYPSVGSAYGDSQNLPQVGNGGNTQDKLFQTSEANTQIANVLSTPQPTIGYVPEPLSSPGDIDYNPVTLGDNVCIVCLGRGVYKFYKNKGDLNRHMKEHTMPGRFLCIETLCNRSVDGNGFTRKDKLQSHLETKHKMSKAQASYRVGQVAVRVRHAGNIAHSGIGQ